MTKKIKLIIGGSTVLAGSVITGIAVPLSQKANEQKQEQEKIAALTKEYETTLSEANDKLGAENPELNAIKNALPDKPTAEDLQKAINEINELISNAKQKDEEAFKTKKDNAKNTINGLSNLSPEEIQSFINKVDSITEYSNEKEIDTIVNEAKEQNSKNLLAKQKEAELAKEESFKTKKDNAKTTIKGLSNLTPVEIKWFINKVDSITEYSNEKEIDTILNEAKEQNLKNLLAKQKEAELAKEESLKTKKDNAKTTISGLSNLTPDEIKSFVNQVDLVTEYSNKKEIDSIVKEAEDQNSKNLLAKQKKAEKIAESAKLTDLKVTRDPTDNKYFIFQLTTDKTTYEKIKNSLFWYEIDIEGTNEYQEDTTNGWKNEPTYFVSEHNGKVTFQTAPIYPQPKGDKKYIISKIWLADDPNKTNLLVGKAEFQ